MNTEPIVPPAVYELSRLADCADPDSTTSPGGVWLTDLYEAWDDNRHQYDDVERMITEIADGAVPTGTHAGWLVYVDLCAYREDLSDYSVTTTDMTEVCRLALCVIAERTVAALEFHSRKDQR